MDLVSKYKLDANLNIKQMCADENLAFETITIIDVHPVHHVYQLAHIWDRSPIGLCVHDGKKIFNFHTTFMIDGKLLPQHSLGLPRVYTGSLWMYCIGSQEVMTDAHQPVLVIDNAGGMDTKHISTSRYTSLNSIVKSLQPLTVYATFIFKKPFDKAWRELRTILVQDPRYQTLTYDVVDSILRPMVGILRTDLIEKYKNVPIGCEIDNVALTEDLIMKQIKINKSQILRLGKISSYYVILQQDWSKLVGVVVYHTEHASKHCITIMNANKELVGPTHVIKPSYPFFRQLPLPPDHQPVIAWDGFRHQANMIFLMKK